MEQLRNRYGERHPRFDLTIPPGANYVVLNYPPMPFDVYDYSRDNLQRPIGSTVRLSPGQGMLSTDLVAGGAFPLLTVWQDADQSAGPFLSLLPPVDRIAPPEQVVPSGIAFDDCFLRGNCSQALLQQIYDAEMTLRVIYLRVQPDYGTRTAIPLRMVDDTWTPPAQARSAHLAQAYHAYLPDIRRSRLYLERPVGFFDSTSGRMVGYLP
jgi:hypothetical protein